MGKCIKIVSSLHWRTISKQVSLLHIQTIHGKMWIQGIWTSGIDWNLPGNGGPDCAKYSSPQRQVLEFIGGTTLALISLLIGSCLHTSPSPIRQDSTKIPSYKLKITYLLLISMSITYLAEAGYKIYTHQAIFIANPCHCLCLVQIFILYRWLKQVDCNIGTEP